MKNTRDIRSSFLSFFKKYNHEIVPSISTVPKNDPSMMFTNSGMVQFKDVFLGKETRDYTRAVSSQKCVRAGGKHNDLENVGYTKRHLTFFEMLGNFSFGDYFKENAIKYAWEFITKELSLDVNRIYITVYHTDYESLKLWKKITNFDDSKIIKIKTNDNFWSMGSAGPCGPCSEIFYDQGDEFFGGLPGTKDEDGDRYVEIWNLVFMQNEMLQSGKMVDLPKRCIDTGMGLERISAITQGVFDNFETDSMRAIIDAISDITLRKFDGNTAHKIIADHLRSSAFLIADGVLPSNEGRGYVLRRILRRAIRQVQQRLGYSDLLMHQLVPALSHEMQESYPELMTNKEFISDVLKNEEQSFRSTLDKGIHLLNKETALLSKNSTLSGKVAFKLHDTYGFPVDLTQCILQEQSISVDMDGFNEEMQMQKSRAREAWSGSGEISIQEEWFDIKSQHGSTEFLGYDTTNAKGTVLAILHDDKAVGSAGKNDEVWVVLDQTPFYGESGGQLGDVGAMYADVDTNSEIKVLIEVKDTKKPLSEIYAHKCLIKSGFINVGDVLKLSVNVKYRNALRRNHTATHLLHSALRSDVSSHISQKGSLVADDKLRFDFSCQQSISREQLDAIELKINKMILENYEVKTQIMKYEDAVKSGAMALFGEKYASEVRVISIDEPNTCDLRSIELCGGTHVSRLGEIGVFKILSEASIAAGIRRIEASTGDYAFSTLQQSYGLLKDISMSLQVKEVEVLHKIAEILSEKKALEKEVAKSKQKNLSSLIGPGKMQKVGDINVLCDTFMDISVEDLRNAAQSYVTSNSDVVLVIFASFANKLGLICGVSKSLHNKLKAADLLKNIGKIISVKGGGGPLIAQGVGEHKTNYIQESKKLLNQIVVNC